MKVDRLSFLALALGACSTGPSVGLSAVEIPRQPPQPRDAGALPPKLVEPKTSPLASGNSDEPEEASDEPDEDTCGFVDPVNVTRPSGPCSDDQATKVVCASLKACGSDTFARERCEAYRKSFKPRLAERAFNCLAKMTGRGVCDACATYRCGDRALKSSCPDPSADSACFQITSKCKSVSMTECRLYLSGLNAVGRASVVTCLTTAGHCGYGIYSCAEAL